MSKIHPQFPGQETPNSLPAAHILLRQEPDEEEDDENEDDENNDDDNGDDGYSE